MPNNKSDFAIHVDKEQLFLRADPDKRPDFDVVLRIFEYLRVHFFVAAGSALHSCVLLFFRFSIRCSAQIDKRSYRFASETKALVQ